MDDGGLNMRNWGYYEPSLKGQFGLQLVSSPPDHTTTRSFLSGRGNPVLVTGNGAFHPRDCVVSDAPLVPVNGGFLHRDCVVSDASVVPANYSWIGQRDKYLNVLPRNHTYLGVPKATGAHQFQMLQQSDAQSDDTAARVGDSGMKKEAGGSQTKAKGGASKTLKAKKPRKSPKLPKDRATASGTPRMKQAKKILDVVINGINMDISGIPIPVCSCTGAPQQCYRWGCGGWQSACCTTSVSTYPLPMSTKRRGARIAGRKMSQGAFKKVLERLATEGYAFSNPIDLRTHWAKHGTNKFVTIR